MGGYYYIAGDGEARGRSQGARGVVELIACGCYVSSANLTPKQLLA